MSIIISITQGKFKVCSIIPIKKEGMGALGWD